MRIPVVYFAYENWFRFVSREVVESINPEFPREGRKKKVRHRRRARPTAIESVGKILPKIEVSGQGGGNSGWPRNGKFRTSTSSASSPLPGSGPVASVRWSVCVCVCASCQSRVVDRSNPGPTLPGRKEGKVSEIP